MATILLVDDDEQYRSMLSEVLYRADYEVYEARDGNEALKIYREWPTDLVITDLIMPGKEGLETIQELRRSNPEVRIIAISGGGRVGPENYLQYAAEFGAQRILAKPFSHRELLDAINQVLSPVDRLGISHQDS